MRKFKINLNYVYTHSNVPCVPIRLLFATQKTFRTLKEGMNGNAFCLHFKTSNRMYLSLRSLALFFSNLLLLPFCLSLSLSPLVSPPLQSHYYALHINLHFNFRLFIKFGKISKSTWSFWKHLECMVFSFEI